MPTVPIKVFRMGEELHGQCPLPPIADTRDVAQDQAMRVASLAFLLPLVYLAAGCARVSEEMDRPDDQSISSRVARPSGGELLVAVTYPGGGAGDTIHRLLACASSARSCELLASVDTNDRPPPSLVPEGARIRFRDK